jgi:hypothetical protein
MRGGAVEVLATETGEMGVLSPWMFRNASVLKPARDFPLS